MFDSSDEDSNKRGQESSDDLMSSEDEVEDKLRDEKFPPPEIIQIDEPEDEPEPVYITVEDSS
jgi:hypothetical protein